MSDALPLFLRTIDELILSSSICGLYVWAEEPTKFSHAWIHHRSDHFCVASIFDVDGSYEGIEDIHRIKFDAHRFKFVQSLPFLERELASEMAKPFQDAQNFESFLVVVSDSGQPCEIMGEDMESTVGKVLAADEWSVLVAPLDENSRTFDGKLLIDLDQVHYPWACTKRTRLMSE